MASDLIQKASQRVIDVFNALPRPAELHDFDVWQMIHDASGTVFPAGVTPPAISDTYYAWVCAKVNLFSRRFRAGAPPTPESDVCRRFAVGIRWTGDELERDLERAVGEKITRAVLGFCDMAEEFEEGGALPEPIVGVPILAMNRPMRVTGVWLRHDGLLIERGKVWYHLVKEHTQDGLSHIVEPAGMLKAQADEVTRADAYHHQRTA